MTSDGGQEAAHSVGHVHTHYRACEIELSDDGSSVISESEHDHTTSGATARHEQPPFKGGRRRSSVAKQRKGSGATSQLSPPLGGAAQHTLGSTLPGTYPVSIRQQLAIIKQMEQPSQNAADSGGGHNVGGSCSPGNASGHTPKGRRIPKVHKKNERGETPLHVAARRGEHRQCKKLLSEGALVNAGDYAGWTPLHEACSHAHFKVAKILIDGGANVNACSESLDTPLHDASSNGCEKLVWLLLHAGADRERVNSAGKRPVDLCPPECSSVYALLSSSSVPERCPSGGESPALQPLRANQLVKESANASHALSVSITSPGDGSALKQPTPSPAETDITVHSETCLKGESREFAHHPDSNNSVQPVKIPEQHVDLNVGPSLHAQEQVCVVDSGAVTSGEVHEVKAKADEISSDKLLPSKEPSPPVTRRSVWREEKDISVKVEEATSGTQACSYEEDLSRDAPHHEADVAVEQESRRGGRTRGAPRKFSSQPPSQGSQKPPTVPERRKQRGRRRGRGGGSCGVLHPPHQTTPVDDVYEFRSSPESDINVNKAVGELGREMSAPPAAKRQRVMQPTPSPAPPEFVEEEQHDGQEESNDVAGGGVNESNDDRTDDISGRKVPPLRISLPRTPSEEGAVVTGTDEISASATNSGKRKGLKGHIKKQPSPDEGIPVEESGQRVTRSKVRQSGRQLREHPGSSCDGSTKRKGGQNGWRQRSVAASATNASSVAPSVVANDEQETITEIEQPPPLPPPNGGVEMVSEGTNTPQEEISPSPMSLMQRNSYEGFRGLRSLIEQRWIKATSRENDPAKPSPPANYDQYMTVQRTYTPGNVDPCSSLKGIEEDQELAAELTAKLHELRTTQSERRHHMEVSHRIERERLQMLAEREVLRNLTRKANQDKDELSAIRIIRESDIYNTWYMEGEREPRSVMEDDDLKMKFERLGILTENRHKLESDALFAEQVFAWNTMIQKSGNPTLNKFKNKVPRVPVVQIRFSL